MRTHNFFSVNRKKLLQTLPLLGMLGLSILFANAQAPTFNYGGRNYDCHPPLPITITPDYVTNISSEPRNVIHFAGMPRSYGYSNLNDGFKYKSNFNTPQGMAIDSKGFIYVADGYRIRKVTPSGTVSTFVGSKTEYGDVDGVGAAARFGNVRDIVIDAFDNLYVVDSYNKIKKVDQNQVVTTVCGGGPSPTDIQDLFSSKTLANAYFDEVGSIAIDGNGILYVTNASAHILHRIDIQNNLVTVFAGSDYSGYPYCQDGPLLTARFFGMSGLAVSRDGSVIYVSDDETHCIRKIANGQVTTYAGATAYTEDPIGMVNSDDPTLARFNRPGALELDGEGNLYVADVQNKRVRKITPQQQVTTFVGSGDDYYTTNGGFGESVNISSPKGLVFDHTGNLYISTADGVILQSGFGFFQPDSNVDPGSTVEWYLPEGFVLNTHTGEVSGTFMVPLISNNSGFRGTIGARNEYGATFAGYLSYNDFWVNYFPIPQLIKFKPIPHQPLMSGTAALNAVTTTNFSNINFSYSNLNLSSPSGSVNITPTTGPGSTVTFSGTGTAIIKADFPTMSGYVNAPTASRVLTFGVEPPILNSSSITVTPGSTISITNAGGLVPAANRYIENFIGDGNSSDDDGYALIAGTPPPPRVGRIYKSTGLDVDAYKNVYVADRDHEKIKKYNSRTGYISSYAGMGAGNTGSTNGVGSAASFNQPADVAVDASGNVYVSDLRNHLIRKITPTADENVGNVTTYAGTGQDGNDDGLVTSASFGSPFGIDVDADYNVYVADQANNNIRKISAQGVVSTLISGLNSPIGVAVGNDGRIYVSNTNNNQILVYSPAGVLLRTIGSGSSGFLDGNETVARFGRTGGIDVDQYGNIFVTDLNNNRVRKITPDGLVYTIAGNGRSSGIEDTSGLLVASFETPYGISVDDYGTVYVADYSNTRIRKFSDLGYSFYPPLPVGVTFDPNAQPNPTIDATYYTGPETTHTVIATNLGGSSSIKNSQDIPNEAFDNLKGTVKYGDVITLSVNASSNLPITYSLEALLTDGITPSQDILSINGNVVTLTGIGKTRIKASQPGDFNYNAAPNKYFEFEVSKKSITITPKTDTKIYDGNKTSDKNPVLGSTVMGDALVTGDRITTQASQEFEQEKASESVKLNPSATLGLVIKNSNDDVVTDYYTLVPSQTVINGKITKRPLKVTAVTDTKTYDGTTTASEGKVPTVEPTATGSGLAPNHVVKTPPNQIFASKDVPVAPAANVNITCSGLAIKDAKDADVSSNYTITYEPYANGVINKRVIEITANDNSKTYGDADPTEFTASVTSAVKPVENEEPIGALKRDEGENVKFNANNIDYYSINQGDYTYGPNYSESFIPGKFYINKRSTTISTVTDTKKYKADDASSDEAPVGSHLLATDVVTSGQYFNTSAIGSNILMKLKTPVAIMDNATKLIDKTSNYNITSTIETATGEITAKNVPVITFNPSSISGKKYGDEAFDIVASSTVNGQTSTVPTLTSSDDNIATVTDNKTITIKGVGEVTITATLAETTDNAAATKTLTFIIGTKALTLKDLNVSARNYDGTRTATITHSGFNETLVGTDVVTLHKGTATFEQKDVKTNIKVSHTGYYLEGTDEAKYSLIIPDILYGNINVLPITIQTKNASKYYGQEDPAFEAIIATDSPNQPVAGDTPTGRLTRELGNDVKFDAQNNVTYYKIIRDENAKYSYGSNYDETFNFGQFTINKRPITVKTVTATKKFNPDAPNDVTTIVKPIVSTSSPSMGLVSTDTLTSTQHFASASIAENIPMILNEVVIKNKATQADKTSNYEITKFETATGNITDKDIQTVTITNPITGASTYGDSQFTLTVNSSSGLTPTFVSSDTNVATVDANGTVTIVGAGTVTITVSVPGNDTYAPQSEPITITVNKKELTLLNLKATDGGKTYDGTTSVTVTHGDLNGIVNSDVITLEEGTVAFEDKNAGDNKNIIFTGYKLKGAKEANYTLTLSLTADIQRRSITITANDTTKTYGNADPVFTAKVTSEIKPVTGEKASGSLTRATGETVGKYDILIGTYSYGTNYYITFISDKLTIEKRKITVTARPETKKFNGNDLCTKTPIFNKTTLAPGDVLFTEATQHFSGTTVRTWDIVPDPLIIKNALGQNATPNYDIDYRTAINGGKITNKEVQIITVTSNLPATITYGDGPYVATPTSSAVPTLTVFNYSSDNENIATIDNNGHITITGAGEVNLYITQPGDVNNIYESETYVIHLNILKKALTINAVSTDKPFDNTASSNGTPTYSGLVSGDSFVGLKQEFASRKVGNSITLNIVEPVVIKKGDRDVTNCYEITKNTAIGNITPSTYQIPLTITKSPTFTSSKEYDATTNCVVLQDFTFDGKEEGDDVICTASAEYQSADVNTAGTQITIKYTLSGKDRDNYKEPASETKTGYITPKLLTILTDPKVPVKVKDYDGTDKAEAIAGTFSGRYDKDINDLTLDPTAKYSDKNAGPGKTIEVKYTLKGNARNNYKLPDGYKYIESGAEIKQLRLKVKNTKVDVTKMYNPRVIDKTANVPNAGELTNLVDGESLTLRAFGFYDDDQPGANKTITVSYKLEGDESVVRNYLPPKDSIINNGEILALITFTVTSTELAACQGSNLNLTYESTGKPVQYKVKFDNSASTDIPYTALESNNTITIQLPENLKYGNHTGTLTMKNVLDKESTPVDFTFKVNISDDLILTKYVNVVFVNNFDKEFTAYQWYKKASGTTDFVKIEGATKQYYQDKEGLVGEYKVEITTNNNDKFFTCPKLLNMPLPASVKAYPNPVNRIQPVTVITVGVSEKELEGANMTIFSSQGLAVYSTTKVEKQTSVPQLPAAGIYIGRVTTAEGNEYQFKIVVIE